MNKEQFDQRIMLAAKQIQNLPNCEMKYYLYILIHSIKEYDLIRCRDFLVELEKFINALEKFNVHYNAENPSNNEHLIVLTSELNQHLLNLKQIAQTHNFIGTVYNILLNIAGVLAATACGIVGGLIGAIAGFGRGFVVFNPITGFGVGLVVGIWFGAVIGFRTPKKLFQNELNRQLRYGLNGLELSLNHNEINTASTDRYFQDANAQVREKFNSDEEFNNFLSSDVSFDINTYYASFIGNSMLHKYAGHHVYVKFQIQDQEFTMDFGTHAPDTTRDSVQSETRMVKGAKLIEMLSMHKKFQETETADFSFIVNTMKPGEIDCFTYVNKLLIATGQQGTMLKRFDYLNTVGTKIGFFVEKLSPFKNDFFKEELAPQVN